VLAGMTMAGCLDQIGPGAVTVPPPEGGGEQIELAANEQRLFIGPERRTCQGFIEQQCLQVRESLSDPWGNFYSEIEGLVPVNGVSYEVIVEVTEIPNPPADASSRRYQLVEIVTSVPAE